MLLNCQVMSWIHTQGLSWQNNLHHLHLEWPSKKSTSTIRTALTGVMQYRQSLLSVISAFRRVWRLGQLPCSYIVWKHVFARCSFPFRAASYQHYDSLSVFVKCDELLLRSSYSVWCQVTGRSFAGRGQTKRWAERSRGSRLTWLLFPWDFPTGRIAPPYPLIEGNIDTHFERNW